MSEYKFYMQKCLKDGTPIEGTLKDLERDFDGLRYSQCVGLNTYGKAQNIHKETYAEKDGFLSFIPDVVTNASTTITLTLYFFGENRQASYDLFYEYIKDGYTRYWDDARNKSFVFIVEQEFKPKDDNWYKGKPYLSVDCKLTNIMGKTVDV